MIRVTQFDAFHKGFLDFGSDLQLPSLQRRLKEIRLDMFYKISRGLLSAIPPTDIITPVKKKRKIKAKTFGGVNGRTI